MTQNILSDEDAQSRQDSSKPFIEPSFRDAVPHYLPLGVFPLFFMALTYRGWWLLPTFLFMSVAGGLDRAFGLDGENMNPSGISDRRLFIYNIPVWSWAFLWVSTLIYGLWQVLLVHSYETWWAIVQGVLLVFLLTMEAQAVFVVGHELVHRRSTWERRLGELLLACCTYPQYATEHVYIHHASVGTPHDVGSAPKGKSFWRYFPEEVVSNLTNSWRVAGAQLTRRGLTRWHFSNPFWRYAIYLGVWYGLVYFMGGIWAIPIFLALGLSCVFSMKISNYFQHYGLRRILLSNGRWEKILPRHSWNADWKFSNWMFFNMQRHADHHSMATRPYPQLQTRADEAPVLPGTYGDMMNLVLRPKSWFAKMDPLVDQWRKKFYPEIDDWGPYDSRLAAIKPDLFEEIIEIHQLAPRLVGWIEQYPELLNTLQHREFTDLDLSKGILVDPEYETIARQGLARVYWTHDMGVEEMRDQIDEIPTTSAKETAEVIRNWSNEKTFQIGMHVLRENLSLDEASVALANLAEASLNSLFVEAFTEYLEKVGDKHTGGIMLTFLGDLATKKVYPNAEIEVLLIHDGWHTKRLEQFLKFLQELLARLSKRNLLFKPLAHEKDRIRTCAIDETNECLQQTNTHGIPLKTRSRIVDEYGYYTIRHRLGPQLNDVWKELRSSMSLHADLSTEVREFETSISKITTGCTGLLELERVARFLQVKSTDSKFEQSDLTAGEIFDLAGEERLAEYAKLCGDIQAIVSLVLGCESILDQASTAVKTLVATSCGAESFEELCKSFAEMSLYAQTRLEQIRSLDCT